MKKLLIFFITLNYWIFATYQFQIKNSVYAYNAENTHFNETRTTLTYFGNILQPEILILPNKKIKFTVGIGLFIPFDQEFKTAKYFPVIQTQLKFNKLLLNLGSLDSDHNFPTTVINDIAKTVDSIRIINNNRYQISRGRYEYGFQLKWLEKMFFGELYMNWQLKDTINHKERFDAGLINTIDFFSVPLYFAFHYWHNGGHENPHTISITENYVGVIGLRNKTFNILYHYSLFLPDRDGNSSLNFSGQGLYFDYLFNIGIVTIQPIGWVSDTYLNKNNKYFSAEGEPFYSRPFYLGLNIILNIPVTDNFILLLKFKNGTFQADINEKYNLKMIRYDQMIKFNFKYKF